MFSQDSNIYIRSFIPLTLAVYYMYNNSVVKQSSDSKVGKHSVKLSTQSNAEIGYPIFFHSIIKLKQDPKNNS